MNGFSTIDARIIRETMMRELETVNLYQQSVEEAESDAVRHLMEHIRDEEKEHIAELFEMLMILDPGQVEAAQEAHPRAIAKTGLVGVSLGKPHEVHGELDLVPAVQPAGGLSLTVGSMLGLPQ